jgi:hypothetical protein
MVRTDARSHDRGAYAGSGDEETCSRGEAITCSSYLGQLPLDFGVKSIVVDRHPASLHFPSALSWEHIEASRKE